jgi:hypothetical protein
MKTANHHRRPPGSSDAMQPTHVHEVRPRKDHRGVDLISDALPFRSALVDGASTVIETHQHKGDFKQP